MTEVSVQTGSREGKPSRARRWWPRRKRRGMVTALLYAALAAFVLIGVLAINARVQTAMGTSSLQSTLTAAEQSLRRSFANQPQYEANLTAILLSTMPANAIRGTGGTRDIVTPWGGEVFAGGGNTPDDDGTGTASNDRFYISVLGLPEAPCENIAKAYLNRENVVGIDVEGAGGTAFTQVNTAAQIALFDSVAEIVAECDGGNDDKIGIVFR